MKKSIIILILFGMRINLFSQTITEIDQATANTLPDKVNEGVDFGISLGFNTVFHKVFDARISPLDNKLKITDVPKAACLISTGVSVPLSKGKLGGRYYRKLDASNKVFGPVYYVPYGFCFVATVNLISFSSAATGSLFNAKIDGGLGLGYRINDNFQFTLTGEMISYRQPRQFLLDNFNEKILKTPTGEIVSSINPDDNNYFRDKYLGSVSLKFFYLISYKPIK